ncbi:MAG: tripartite tricarboxylate transporter substrate binding protein [Betaproteobacteria bacterium]|jgi:tripartite-type tricarboxylate transporter receptor subunit TctC|nr:tripartite tricarboxylate transporter substrate binding protein [Betaproteobacteria bacterium]
MTQWLLTRSKAIHLTYVLLFSIGLGLTPLKGAAQTFPSKPIKLISGATAGSASDIIARSIAEKLQSEFGVSVFVENKPGAAGTVAIQTIFNSPADGHSIFVYTGAHTVLPLINKVSYDPVKDFSAVTPLAVVPNVMVVSPNKGYKSVKDVVAAAKDKPGQLNYASAGLGSATHMSAEKFKLATGIDAVHVPYKGSPEAITETMTGRIDYFFAPLVSALPMIKAGKLIPLAVSTSKRSSQLPDVPTLAEAGIAKSEYLFWIGMLVSAKTPRDIVNKLNQSTLKALQDNEVKERLVGLGAEAMPMSPEQFDQLIKDELISNAAVIKAAGIKSE